MGTKTISIMDLASSWKDITEEKARKIKTKISEMRKGTRLKELKEKIEKSEEKDNLLVEQAKLKGTTKKKTTKEEYEKIRKKAFEEIANKIDSAVAKKLGLK